jgi:hypothetical protein
MLLLHNVITDQSPPPIVLDHGFACAHSDWDAQMMQPDRGGRFA